MWTIGQPVGMSSRSSVGLKVANSHGRAGSRPYQVPSPEKVVALGCHPAE